MATEKAETDRVPVTLALSTIGYLEKLVRQGTHGTSVPGVARTLIEEGIRLAIKDGLLAIRDNGKAIWERDLSEGIRSHEASRSKQIKPGSKNMRANELTWTTERIQILKSRFEAGRSCREIAVDLGVSRNAVIGKLSRLQWTREENRAPHPNPRTKRAKGDRAKATARLQYQMLKAVYADAAPPPDEPIHNGRCCSLLELDAQRCRWPISTPGAQDFCFCGNLPIDGLPYCAGHARLAYRPNPGRAARER
jgi:GcrA cell cycle regulator